MISSGEHEDHDVKHDLFIYEVSFKRSRNRSVLYLHLATMEVQT